jgi:natural product precursor
MFVKSSKVIKHTLNNLNLTNMKNILAKFQKNVLSKDEMKNLKGGYMSVCKVDCHDGWGYLSADSRQDAETTASGCGGNWCCDSCPS